jgi:hypothetical protein
MVSLTKIVNGKFSTNETLSDERVVTCPLCEQAYLLRYGENERHHLSAWLKKADTAMRKSHIQDGHEGDVLKLRW